ncbi:MAG: CBS domain-containing protein [Actinomycetota bacterium]
MTIEQILQAKSAWVSTIEPDVQISRAVYRMVAGGIGALVVSTDGESVEGIISERDVVRGLEYHGERLFDLKVRDLMSKNVPVCRPDDKVSHAMAEMTRSKSRHLPVVRDGKLVGIVSLGDVVKHRLDEIEMEKTVLRDLYIAKS